MGLAVTDLACQRAGRRVLDGVSFAVPAGGALILRGPNGAGKSTLLRTLAGLLPPAAGTAALDGADLRRDPDAFAERLAYAGHLDAIKAQLTVAENLAFWAALFGAAPGAVAAGLDAFGLGALADRPAYACSAGQRRRLGLARLALAPRRLWLLDEPTVSLDAASSARFAALLGRHCAGGGIAVVATHVDLGLGTAAVELILAPPSAPAVASDPFLAERFA